jgi:hypothetical protein
MSANPNKMPDPLHQYAQSVGSLQDKLDRVLSNQQAVAASLSRAAAALRSISAARRQNPVD